MRDFLYVSERKVDRIAPTLPPRVSRRLKELRFNAGPVGAGVVFADSRAETAVAAVIEVERAIYSEFGVRDVNDPGLAAGDWFSAEVLDMAYGVQITKSVSKTILIPRSVTSAAVFTAKMPGSYLLLSGSAVYLLDRSVPRTDAGEEMSNPQAIMEMLAKVTEDAHPDDSSHGPGDFSRSAIYAAANLYTAFARFGLHPLRFLARAISILSLEQYPETLVLGTPLFVEYAQRE